MDSLQAVGEVIRSIAGMTWRIAWGLILGFAVSGAIQTFVSKEKIAQHLGAVSPRSLLLAAGFGAASSSCSYAAAAMSKTLFRKGAHIVTATAFLFASTNLVLEIGLVIWVLLGWRFVVAELFGGLFLIIVVAVLLKWFAPRQLFEKARQNLEAEQAGMMHEHDREHAHHEHDHGRHDHEHHDHQHGTGETLPLRSLPTARGIQAMARYFATDFRMVGKDIILGLVIAGALAALVPRSWWATVFLSGTGGAGGQPGFWVSLENAVVGPLIAVVSFVCSVGNIPLAAVLWDGGISFGGVVAFIFADLVTLPMILVYRRYYGWAPALVYAAYLLITMIVTALIVEYLFRWIGLVPSPVSGIAPGIREMRYFAWDYTTFLNLVFIPLGLVLAWIGVRKRGGQAEHAGHQG